MSERDTITAPLSAPTSAGALAAPACEEIDIREIGDSKGLTASGALSGSDRFADLSDASQTATNPPTASGLPKWLGKRVGRFRLVALLGRGSWGRVFEAEDTTLRRRVALKLLPTVDTNGLPASDFDRVATEARAAAAMEHPNAIAIYEIGKKGEFFYLAMELAEGGSVEELMKATGPLDAARACTLAAEAGDALALAHECGIVHRDVKPANLLLSRSGRCKVCDFGLAAGGDVSSPLHATRAAGTAHYVAPEVVCGNEATARSDLYSLGATLYHMLTGRRPFEGLDRRSEVLRAQVMRQPPDLGTLRPDLDEKLVNLVKKAMSKNPAERFLDIHEFARGLRLFTVPLAGKTPASMPGDPKFKRPKVNLKRWMPAAVGTVGLGVVAALLIAGFSGGPGAANATPTTPLSSTGSITSAPPALRLDGPTRSHAFQLDASQWTDKPVSVHVAGSFNAWNETATPLNDDDQDHIWTGKVPLTFGTHQYKFIIDGSRWVSDDSADKSLEIDDGYGARNSGVIIK